MELADMLALEARFWEFDSPLGHQFFEEEQFFWM